MRILLLEDKIDGKKQKYETIEMVQSQCLGLEDRHSKNREYDKRYGFLDDLQFEEAERTSVVAKTDAVGWHHHAIFKQCYEPADKDYHPQTMFLEYLHLAKAQMSIPRKGHEDV